MMFILLVVAILLVRFQGLGGLQPLNGVLAPWYRRLASRPRLGRGRLYLLVAAPVLVLLLALGLLKALGWTWVIYLVSGLVLLASFGAAGLRERVDAYVEDLKREDIQAAYHAAAGLNEQHRESEAQSWRQLHEETLRAVSSRFYECYFPVIFWFLILGAPGALLYRAVAVLHDLADGDDQARLGRLQATLDWLPARVFGASLALVGNFQPVMAQLSRTLLDHTTPTADAVTRYVRAALLDVGAPADDAPGQQVWELEALPALIDRTLVTWIAVIGLLAVF